MTKISVSLSLENDLIARVDAIAEAEGVRRSWIIDKVVTGWLDQRELHQPLEHRQPGAKAAGVGRRPKPRSTVEATS